VELEALRLDDQSVLLVRKVDDGPDAVAGDLELGTELETRNVETDGAQDGLEGVRRTCIRSGGNGAGLGRSDSRARRAAASTSS
jgi:hypothetical protein